MNYNNKSQNRPNDTKTTKQIELMRILEAWKQATIYLKKNKASIKYSNIPEPETTRTQKKGKNK